MKSFIVIFLLSLTPLLAQVPNLDKLLNLTNVTNVVVEVGGIKLTHSDGVKRIPTAKLPAELVRYYKLNSSEDQKALEEKLKAEAERQRQKDIEEHQKQQAMLEAGKTETSNPETSKPDKQPNKVVVPQTTKPENDPYSLNGKGKRYNNNNGRNKYNKDNGLNGRNGLDGR